VDRAGSAGGLLSRLQALFRALVPRDLWPVIARAREVLLVPDGALHGLPFEALVVALSPDGRPTYWLDEGPVVSYAPSATTACNLARRREERGSPERSALVVANPLFAPAPDRRRLGSLPPLPGTAGEAARIRHALEAAGDDVVVLSDAGAGEAAVREALASRTRTYLHFATHGLVQQGGNELLAALALAVPGRPAPPADDDGLLQLFEIYELDARSELTVLSACDSHTGRRVTGEGVFALSRAFLAAGARRVVASLWPVDDASTAYLMGAFYERVAGASAPADVAYARALRDARRDVRAKAEWSHPYYWAPFVATGAR
jgi:CHAT domain-containing protein